jgi:hypothetical protein
VKKLNFHFSPACLQLVTGNKIGIFQLIHSFGEGEPQPALSSVRQATEPGEGVKSVRPHSIWI